MKMVQIQFERKVRDGIRHTTAWVDATWRLKQGNVVTFDHEEGLQSERRWTVVRVGKVEQEYAEINQKWKVGGLT